MTNQFELLLNDCLKWGLKFEFMSQTPLDEIAQANILAQDFLEMSPSTLILWFIPFTAVICLKFLILLISNSMVDQYLHVSLPIRKFSNKV